MNENELHEYLNTNSRFEGRLRPSQYLNEVQKTWLDDASRKILNYLSPRSILDVDSLETRIQPVWAQDVVQWEIDNPPRLTETNEDLGAILSSWDAVMRCLKINHYTPWSTREGSR